jgi:hypothetical protein
MSANYLCPKYLVSAKYLVCAKNISLKYLPFLRQGSVTSNCCIYMKFLFSYMCQQLLYQFFSVEHASASKLDVYMSSVCVELLQGGGDEELT